MPSTTGICAVGSQTSPGQSAGAPAGASVSWTNPQNITADDTSYASASPANSATTYYLKGSTFSHQINNIPDDSVIDGIELRIRREGTSNNTTSDSDVRISGVDSGLSDAETADIGASWSTVGLATYGGPTSKWGKDWTVNELKNGLFAAYLSITNSAPVGSPRSVDYMETVVYYTELSSSSNFPGTTSSSTNMPNGSTITWNNTSNITSDNNQYAATSAGLTTGAKTRFLNGSNYGFSIPSSAEINGIKLTVEVGQFAGSSVSDLEVRVSGSSAGLSDSKTLGSNWQSNGQRVYGGTEDTWGKTWTPSEINSSSFVAMVSAQGAQPFNFSPTEVDYFKVEVYYTDTGDPDPPSQDTFNIRFGEVKIDRVMMGSQPVSRSFFGSQEI